MLGEVNYDWFKKKVYDLTGIDLNNYRPKQMERRISSLMERVGAKDYREYHLLLAKRKEHYQQFLNHITINVSEFFRNPERFKELETKILPELLRESSRLKIWSAACSYGAEPYTIAMILERLAPGKGHRVLATDLDKQMLEKAKLGKYSVHDVKNIEKSLLDKYFTQDGTDYILSEQIKKKVDFKHHDLLKDSYEQGFDLIVCRNVVIYFTDDAKDKLYRQFHQSLRKNGYLFVGGTERIHNYREMGYENVYPFFYKKV